MKAIWNGAVVAESMDTVVVEGNHYFPAAALKQEFVLPSRHTTTCGWKGEAAYISLNVNGAVNENAVWYYEDPKKAADAIRGRVAFWHGMEVVP